MHSAQYFHDLWFLNTTQAYNAELKAKKIAGAAAKGDCDQYKIDKNGRCPGDTGYVSFVKEDVPQDFAVSVQSVTSKLDFF